MSIRPETSADRAAIFEVHRMAFGQDAEAKLVDDLRDGGFVRLSLVAEVDCEIVGHILFSRLPIITNTGMVEALSLAPMSVLPSQQRKGIGSRLVEEGTRLCQAAGHKIVLVLGHPSFYPRFGFSANLAQSLASPFGSRDSWMAMELAPGVLAGVVGRADYPPPFSAF
jgi:putative acetyltransferase